MEKQSKLVWKREIRGTYTSGPYMICHEHPDDVCGNRNYWGVFREGEGFFDAGNSYKDAKKWAQIDHDGR